MEKTMKRLTLSICFGVALVVAGYMWGHHTAPIVHAQGKISFSKSWGHVVGTLPTKFVVLEDSDGVIRVADMDTGEVIGIVYRN